MVKLWQLRTLYREVGTVAGAFVKTDVASGYRRNVYMIQAQQRGATLSELRIKAERGTTAGTTLMVIRFSVAKQEKVYGDPIREDSQPLFQINATQVPTPNRADDVNVQASSATVDLTMVYADEDGGLAT